MSLLLDTHAVLWWVSGSTRLPASVVAAMLAGAMPPPAAGCSGGARALLREARTSERARAAGLPRAPRAAAGSGSASASTTPARIRCQAGIRRIGTAPRSG